LETIMRAQTAPRVRDHFAAARKAAATRRARAGLPLAPAAPPAAIATREGWLNAFTAAARPHFARVGAPLPVRIRMAVGFTSKGSRGKRIGECWGTSSSADQSFEIFIVPSLADSARVADVLTHELVHAAAGLAAGHGPRFRRVATALGLTGKMTATTAGPDWFVWAQPILDRLGPIPHAALAGGVTAGPPKQRSRHIKRTCGECGFTFRVAQCWIDGAAGALRCPDPGCDGETC
jgi:hypothetical protein